MHTHTHTQVKSEGWQEGSVVKVLAAKADILSSNSRAHKGEEENRPSQLSSDLSMYDAHRHTDKQTHSK